MAGIALQAGRYVRDRFCERIGEAVSAVMAGGTIGSCHWACCAGVVHLPRTGECDEVLVTGIALGSSRDVIGRLAQRSGAVMAGRALTCRRTVVGVGGGSP